MNQIKSLSIECFRGIYSKEEMQFAIPNGTPGSGLTIIVGPNNSGKTTLLDAIWHHFQNIQVNENERYLRKDCVIESQYLMGMGTQTISNGTGIILKNPEGRSLTVEYLYSRSDWNSSFQNSPSFSYLDYVGFLATNFRDKNYKDTEFSKLFTVIEKDVKTKTNLNLLVKKFFKNFSDWYLEGNRIEYQVNETRHHVLDRFGSGFKNVFRILTCLILSPIDFLLIIDEPEFSLHPQAIKVLGEVLAQFSSKKQIVITTHSPHFIDWAYLKNGCKIVRTQKRGDKCKIFSLDKNANEYEKLLKIDYDWQKPQMLDAVAKEIFFSENILVVEGQEDVGLLKKYFKENKKVVEFDVFGYGAGGAGNIDLIMSLAQALGINCAALFDLNKKDQIDVLRKKYLSGWIGTIPTEDIRDKEKNDGSGRKEFVEGMFERSGTIKQKYVAQLDGMINELNSFFVNS